MFDLNKSAVCWTDPDSGNHWKQFVLESTAWKFYDKKKAHGHNPVFVTSKVAIREEDPAQK